LRSVHCHLWIVIHPIFSFVPSICSLLSSKCKLPHSLLFIWEIWSGTLKSFFHIPFTMNCSDSRRMLGTGVQLILEFAYFVYKPFIFFFESNLFELYSSLYWLFFIQPNLFSQPFVFISLHFIVFCDFFQCKTQLSLSFTHSLLISLHAFVLFLPMIFHFLLLKLFIWRYLTLVYV
jgi:hypothetical protein